MEKGGGNGGRITQTARDRLKKEKNLVLRELQALEQKYNLAVDNNEALKQSLASLKGDVQTKDLAIGKYQSKYAKGKEKVKDLREKICQLEREADHTKIKIENLQRAKKFIAEEKKTLLWELRERTNTYLLSKLNEDGIELRGNRNDYHSSRGYHSRRPFDSTTSRPNQRSNDNRYYRSSGGQRYRR